MKTRFEKLSLLLALVGLLNFAAFTQASTKDICPEKTAKEKLKPKVASSFGEGGSKKIVPPKEKAIATDSKPLVSLCVTSGSVRIRGWQRDEVRAIIEGGNLGFKVLQRNPEKKVAHLNVLGYESEAEMSAKTRCLSGRRIELEVPYGTSIKLESRSYADVLIDTIAKANVRNTQGNVLLRGITDETEVSSLSGSILTEDSTGKFSLKSVSGNVAAYRLRPSNITDAVRATSNNGNVVLQDVAHGSVEAGSTSGELVSFGAPVRGGSYNFQTTTGTITLFLPAESSFEFNATLSAGGDFQSTLPIKTRSQDIKGGQSRRVTGVVGAGEASVNLTTFNGVLRLRRK